MFRKLRNKFLILNMTITSLVMIVAFAVIYFLTYNNIHSDIQNKLNSSKGMHITQEGTGWPKEPLKRGAQITSQKITMNDPLSFNIQVDTNGKILNIESYMNLPEDVYYKAAKIAWSHKKNTTKITLDGKQWQYKITQVSLHVIQDKGEQIISKENSYNIVFLDVTASNKTLLELLTTLLLVGFITLVVIFVISLYFANRAIRPIAETWEKQKQFVADASHELKTPLSIINANYDALLANQDETIKSQTKWLGYIRIGTDRMAKLINDLLTLAKIEDVKFETKRISFNFSEDIHDVILSMEAAVIEKGIKLTNLIEQDIFIKSDKEKVKQVVMILYDNAIKYTNENGQIDITLEKSKRQVIFSIKNSGKGIPKQDIPKVFDRFYRADPSRTHEKGGYGLGLSIANTIVNRLDGEIHVTSKENEYTTFTLILGM